MAGRRSVTDQGYTPGIAEVMATAEGHISAEYVGDLEGIMASVSRSPTYAFMSEPGHVATVTDIEGVRRFYLESREQFIPMASRMLTHIASDWYEFFENVPTRKIVSSGELLTMNNVVMFPKASDGIQGEFLWERYGSDATSEESSPDVGLGTVHGVPLRRLSNANIHEALLQRLRNGEPQHLGAMFDETCVRVGRNYASDAEDQPLVKAEGRGPVGETFTAWFNAYDVVAISVLERLATEWYVFAEELYTVRRRQGRLAGQLCEFRKASVYPIGGNGLIQGELGFGTALIEVGDRSVREFGAVSWTRVGEFVDDLCRPRVTQASSS
jgi:hypothetical protein